MASKQEQLIKEIGGLTVLELAQLVKGLESEFGISAAAPVMAGPAAGAGEAAGAAKSEEKSEYKVELLDGGANKINVIKALRSVVGTLGLVEAKKLVEEASASAPSIIAEAASKEDAKKMKEALEAAGAKVKLS